MNGSNTNIDETLLNEFKKKFKNFTNNIDKKIDNISKLKDNLIGVYDKIKEEIDLHFKEIIENEIYAKKIELENQLRLEYESVEADVLNSINESNELKFEIEKNIQIFETKSNQNKSFYNDFDNNDDALMISEANEEILDTSMNGANFDLNNNEINNDTINNHELLKYEEIMNDKLNFDNVNAKLKQFLNQKFIKCNPDIKEVCFGHIGYDSVLDHTHFQIENNSNDNIFIKNQKCSIKISSPAAYSNFINIHEFLKFELFDPKKQPMSFELKERSSNSKRYTKIIFTPETQGLFKLSIKYKDFYIQNCPMYFTVLKETNNIGLASTTMVTSSSFNSTILSPTNELSQVNMIKTEPVEICDHPVVNRNNLINNNDNHRKSSNEKLSGSTISLNNTRPITSAGRGRLIKQIITEQANKLRGADIIKSSKPIDFQLNNNNNNTAFSQSQKRKSPLINYFDENEVIDTDIELCEISTKLKKVVVDETNNQYFQYNSANLKNPNNNNFDFSRLSVHNTPLTNNSYIDNHLRKYASQKFGDIPSLKAVFQRKYVANMSFPIGVAVSNTHNWVLAADNGNNAVKVFERSTGELIFELKGDISSGVTPFKRPSALLINSQDRELYVKDDVQVQVFDIDNNFKFKRRFGANVLKKPYGLATNSKGNIVCVDADLRQPLIYTFDKNGQLLNSKSYQPVIKDLASSLNYPNLSKKLEPFEKTKVRFIYCQQNCLYSSDLGRSIIYKTTLDGEILFAFGHHGKHKGELNEPSGLFVDKNGSILLGDSKNARLQVYDNQGKYKCDIEFVDEKIRRPSDIYLDEDGYLYVSCFLDHCVKKFKLVDS